MEIPMTQEQRQFEELMPVLIKVLSELQAKERTQVFNYAIALYNKGGLKNG